MRRLLLASFLALLARPAQAAAPEQAPAPAQRVIRFGLPQDYPPFTVHRADGELGGADIAAANSVAAMLGARPEFVVTTWDTLAGDFAANRFDVAIGGLTVTPERAALGVYSAPLMDDGKRPMARCAQKDEFPSLAAIDRPGVRVMISRGAAIGVLARTWVRKATLVVQANDAALTKDLLEGRADVWITDGVVIDHMARRHPGRLCPTTLEPFTHLTKAWLIQRDPALIKAVNAALIKALVSGQWRAALNAVP